MKERILGINTFPNFSLPQTDQLDCIKNAGFGAFFADWAPSLTEQVANRAAQLGLIQQSIHAPFSGQYKVSHLWSGGEEGDFVRNALIDCLEDCARFDIPVMVIHPFIGFHDHTPTQTGLDNYERIVDRAEKLGVTLGFENVEGEEYLAAIMDRFRDRRHVGFCFDTGHQMCYNRDTDMLSLYGDRLVHTHINDNLGVRGEEITFYDDIHLLPGDGVADWSEIMRRIRDTGYGGILMSELNYLPRVFEDTSYPHYTHLSEEQFIVTAYQRVSAAVCS